MTVNATWLLTTDLVSKLACKSPIPAMPVYVNISFWDDLKKTNMVDWLTFSNGALQSMVGTHPIYLDNSAPVYSCTQDIINYYLVKQGKAKVSQPINEQVCDCNLGGAHETWCHKWEAY